MTTAIERQLQLIRQKVETLTGERAGAARRALLVSDVQGIIEKATAGNGSFLTSGGDLGTPSGGDLTNCINVPIDEIVGLLAYALLDGANIIGTITDALLPVENLVGAIPPAEGSIIQVVQGTTTTLVSSSSASFVDTGLSATITPRSASSKILVLVNQLLDRYSPVYGGSGLKIMRNSTSVFSPAMDGEYARDLYIAYSSTTRHNLSYLDNPGLTAPITYKTQMGAYSATSITAQPNFGGGPSMSTMILMEVAGP